jgi:hypothetical protein
MEVVGIPHLCTFHSRSAQDINPIVLSSKVQTVAIRLLRGHHGRGTASPNGTALTRESFSSYVSLCANLRFEADTTTNDKDHQVLFLHLRDNLAIPYLQQIVACSESRKHHFSAEVRFANRNIKHTSIYNNSTNTSMTASTVPYSKIHAAYVSFPELGTCSR